MHPFAPPACPLTALAPLLSQAQLVADLAQDLGLLGVLLLAEALALFSAWAEKAFDAHSRAGIAEAARDRGSPERAERLLTAMPSFLLSVRILRFLGKAALVIGLASWVLGDQLRTGACDAAGLVPVPWAGLVAVLGLAFVLNFVVNDVLVGVLARRAPDRFLVGALPVLEALRVVAAPLRLPLALVVKGVFRVSLDASGPGAREEVRESVSEGEREGALSPIEAEMIESIIDLPKTNAGEVLIPRSQVSMLQADTRLVDAIAFVTEDGHTRLPIYGRDRDDVLGWMHVRDLLAHAGRESAQRLTVRELMRPPYFVPTSKPLHDLLDEMRVRKIHLAVVLNEIGATAGVVSLEDLLEQIVGDIHDEHDVEERRGPRSEDVHRGDVQVDARMRVEDANRLLKLLLPIDGEAYDTLAGLLLHRLGKVAQPGERLTLEGVTLTVTEADERRVKRVRVQAIRAAGPAPTAPA